MATMEKPKQKKKKKVNSYQEIDSIVESLNRTTFQSTSSFTDSIQSVECAVASKVPTISEEIVESVTTLHEETENEVCIEPEASAPPFQESPVPTAIAPNVDEIHFIPTAPMLDNPRLSHSTSASNVMFPDLKSMEAIEYHAIPQMRFNLLDEVELNIKPFDDTELNNIYMNTEIQLVGVFESQFIDTELKTNYTVSDHILFEFLKKYAKGRTMVKNLLVELETLRNNNKLTAKSLWEVKDHTATGKNSCSCGATLSASHTYSLMHLDENVFTTLSTNLKELIEKCCYDFVQYSYDTEVYALHIEQKICEILTQCNEFQSIHSSTPIAINTSLDEQTTQAITELRRAISILFYFLRLPIPDKVFLRNLKKWLTKLISLHIRVATWQDHMFLLFHILRSPSGTPTWMASMIQIPDLFTDLRTPFSSSRVDHCLAVLKIVLLPIKQRNDFLNQLRLENVIDPVKDDIWTIIDSDGEEGTTTNGDCVGLKESDLVALLNQIPFENLMRLLMQAKLKNSKYVIDEKLLTGSYILKLFAFSTNLVKILGDGLLTYNTERYRQFAKRLARLVRHVILYVTDIHELFINQPNTTNDIEILYRIQIEYNSFILRTCHYMYNSRSLGTWQYLVDLPFSTLDKRTLWILCYCLTLGFPDNFLYLTYDELPNRINNEDFLNKFNNIAIEIAADDLYYLLQTFCNMILSRDQCDWEFIKIVTIKIFEIGFVNLPTKDICYKLVRDLLFNIADKYPELISHILWHVKLSLTEMSSLASYLFKSLPLNKWKPSFDDLEILSAWLLNFNIDSTESSTARVIISCINWGFDEEEKLFLSHEIHIRMACLLCQVSSRHVPEMIGASGISESVRQMSNFYNRNQTLKQQFTLWCWNMTSRLRLHCMDQGREFVQSCLRNPVEMLKRIPELERIDSVFQGVSESRPLALYVSVLISMCGHSIPEICHKGFLQLHLLLNDHRHMIVIRCLQLITPLFLDCPESLYKSEKFQSILTNLLTIDRTYYKMTKELLRTDSVGLVVELFGSMIQSQIVDYIHYGLPTPTVLIILWLQCLTNNSTINWLKDFNSTFLIDLILKIAYQFPESWNCAKHYLKSVYSTNEDLLRSVKTSNFSLFGGNTQQVENIIPPEHTWLGLLTYEIEHEIFEAKYWPEFLRLLNMTSGRNCVEVALKKATSAVGCNNATSASLVVFKLANYISNIPLEQPILPIITQKFYNLYLARVPLTTDEERYLESLGVTNKFFEQYSSIFKKLKKRFIEIEKYYKETSLKESDEIIAGIQMKCSKLFGTYILWLEEQKLNKMDSHKLDYTIELPPKYDSDRLKLTFTGSSEYWNEFIYMPSIRNQQKYDASKWLKECFRFTIVNNTISSARIADENCAKERIIKRLQSYDQPEAPPRIQSRAPILNELPPLDSCITIFISKFELIKKYANDFYFDTNELQALDATYKDKVRVLYETNSKNIYISKTCSCKGTVPISIKIEYTIKLDRVQNTIDTNRSRYDLLLEKQTISPPANLVLALAQLSHYVRLLVKNYNYHKMSNRNCDQIVSVALKIFYDVVLGEPAFRFIPASDLCSNILYNLSQIIKENQNVDLLKKIIQRPDLADILLTSFNPLLVLPNNYIDMYSFVVELYRKNPNLNENYSILCKFQLNDWLNKFRPRLAEITQLIELIMNGIENSRSDESTRRFEGQFCKDLIVLFEHNFPEHYGEILQVVLKSSSEKQISPGILLELLNSLYRMADCELLRGDVDPLRQKSKYVMFANKQKLFTYKEITETAQLLAKYFQYNRLQYGLHGLYPNHKNHCDVIALMYGTFTHSAIVSLICTYPGVLANQLIEWIWPIICDLYSPWLVTYSKQLKDSASNWLKHATSNDPYLFPCNISHVTLYQKMFGNFISSIQFCLEMLPGGTGILNQIFHWYEIHFANTNTPKHVLNVAHGSLMLLPWNKLEPNEGNMDSFNRLLLQFLPECHVFVGHIYINTDWVSWISRNIHFWNYDIKHRILSFLLMITVKLSFEPTLRENKKIIKLLDDICKFPWHLLEYQSVEGVLNWFVLSTEPSVVLKLPSDGLDIDIGILKLLQYVCGMQKFDENNTSTLYQSKRIIYVRTIVRILRTCGSKYHKLLSSNEGVKLFRAAFTELLTLIESVLNDFYNCDNQETINLLIEIVGSLQAHGELIAKLFVDAISMWQNGTVPGNVLLCCTLNAIGACKLMSFNICSLLESTISNYFRVNPNSVSKHAPSWLNIITRIGPIVPHFDAAMLLQNHLILDLHLFSYCNLKYATNIGDKVTYLNKLHHWIEPYKSNEATESKLVLVWGLVITCAVHVFQQSYNSKNSLLVLARYFQVISTQSEGWGEGLLGVIGLKKDGISNKRRILTRCLACLIFSIFPDETNSSNVTATGRCKEYESAMDELKQALTNRKYNDVRMIAAKSIDIIERFDREFEVFRKNLCTIIRLYYDDPILSTAEDFWNF